MKIFVYGTLKEGGALAGSYDQFRTSCVKATITGFSLYNLGWFPGIVPGEGQVIGEIHTYEPEEELLSRFDRVEGYDPKNEEQSLYLRKEVVAITEDGEEVEAYVYVFNRKLDEDAELIEEGNWPI